MSTVYWMCEGIGIRTNDLYPFLNERKCINAIKEQLPDEEIDEDDFDIDDYFYGEPFQNLGDLLGEKTNRQVLPRYMNESFPPCFDYAI